MAVCDGKEQLY